MFLFEESVLFIWQMKGVAQCAKAAGNDRDFCDTCGTFCQFGHQSMSTFVIGDNVFFQIIDLAVFLLQTNKGPLYRFHQVRLFDLFLVLSACEKSGFVDNIGQIGPCQSGSRFGYDRHVDLIREFDICAVDFEDGEPSFIVGLVYQYLSVKSTGSQQCSIEYFRPVGSCQDNDGGIGTKSVHFCKELIERLLSLIVAAHLCSCRTTLSDRVDFIDEDDGRGLFLGLLKEVSDPARTDSDKHLYKA